MTKASLHRVTVLVCTRNRPADVERAARSLLSSHGVDLELIVVDQSDDSQTEALMRGLSEDGRLRYVRSLRRGKGAAMNEGLRLAKSALVVCTDDDCEAPPNWVAGMAAVLHQRPEVGAVFSNVLAGPHNPSAGYIPHFERPTDRLLRSVLSSRYERGLGAGMALRRDAVLALGGIDEALGPGARFPSADENDIASRMLLRGWSVFQTTQVAIVHHGFRTMAEGREHGRRDWRASGAAMAKLVRAGHPSVVVLALWTFGSFALLPPVNDVLHLRRPRGLGKITAFGKGFVAGCASAVDRRTMTFKPVH